MNKETNLSAEIIKQFEGLSLTAYADPATGIQPYTIGYGHTKGVKKNDRITREQAELWLKQDMALVEKQLDGVVKVPLNPQQFAALTSLVFNIGIGAFEKSTLLKKLNQGDYQGAADEFLRWIHAGGKVLEGLKRRRKAERELFLS